MALPLGVAYATRSSYLPPRLFQISLLGRSGAENALGWTHAKHHFTMSHLQHVPLDNMDGGATTNDGSLRASELNIPSTFELLYDMKLGKVEEAAVRAFITVAEHLQETKPDDPGEPIEILKGWATFLSDSRDTHRRMFKSVIEDAQACNTSSVVLQQALATFFEIASEWQRKEYGEVLKAALQELLPAASPAAPRDAKKPAPSSDSTLSPRP